MPPGKNIDVNGLIKEADKALKEKDEIREKVSGFRDLLRAAVRAGEASPEQVEWVDSTFNRRASE